VGGEGPELFAGGGDDDDGRGESSGKSGKAAKNIVAEGAAADDDQMALGGTGAGAVDGGIGDGLGGEETSAQEEAK
jgi:hypothetical protein